MEKCLALIMTRLGALLNSLDKSCYEMKRQTNREKERGDNNIDDDDVGGGVDLSL